MTRWPYRVLLAGLYSLLSIVALYVFLKYPGLNNYAAKAAFGDHVYGRAWRPFVTRALTPWLVRGATISTPALLRQTIGEFSRRHWPDNGVLSPAHDLPFECAVTAVILLGCLIGFAYALRALAQTALDATPGLRDAVPAGALLALPLMYMCFSALYDLPNLLLFTLGLLFIVRRRPAAYLAVFALATINKETSILLTLVWALHSRHERRDRRYWLILLAQVTIWLTLRGWLAFLYRDNPGSLLEWHLARNLQLLSAPSTYIQVRTAARFIPRGLNIIHLAVPVWILARFRFLPPFVRLALLPLAALAVAALFFGFIEELRCYYEAYPALALGLAASLRRRPAG